MVRFLSPEEVAPMRLRRISRSVLAIQVGAFLLTGLLGALAWWRGAPTPAYIPPDDWQVQDLVAHLDHRGVQLRAVPVMENGPPNGGGFMTNTDLPWDRLNHP